MKDVIREAALRYQTPKEWLQRVLGDFPKFVADHAANERKAAATAMSFVVQYPDRLRLVHTAAKIAEEEISHFRKVFAEMAARGFPLLPDEKDPYVRLLRAEIRSGGDERLMDQLIVASLIETRGMERFSMLVEGHPDSAWRQFYLGLMASERGHGAAFLHEALQIFSHETVELRLNELLNAEAEACRRTPLTHRFH